MNSENKVSEIAERAARDFFSEFRSYGFHHHMGLDLDQAVNKLAKFVERAIAESRSQESERKCEACGHSAKLSYIRFDRCPHCGEPYSELGDGEPSPPPVRCSFCHKEPNQVEYIITSPSDYPKVYICNECVEVCQSVLIERSGAAQEVSPPSPDEDVCSCFPQQQAACLSHPWHRPSYCKFNQVRDGGRPLTDSKESLASGAEEPVTSQSSTSHPDSPRPLGACIRHGYGNSIHEKQDDCVNWWAVAEGIAPLEPTKLTAEQFARDKYRALFKGAGETHIEYYIANVRDWLNFAEAYAAAVSKNLQERADKLRGELTATKSIVSKLQGWINEKRANLDDLIAQITPENIHKEVQRPDA